MSKLLSGIILLCVPMLVLAQTPTTSSRYQPATITHVKPHQSANATPPGQAFYEVSVKTNGMTYVVLTQSPFGDSAILYATGRELLVQVGDSAIIWNDILGESHVVPIIAQGPIISGTKTQN